MFKLWAACEVGAMCDSTCPGGAWHAVHENIHLAMMRFYWGVAISYDGLLHRTQELLQLLNKRV